MTRNRFFNDLSSFLPHYSRELSLRSNNNKAPKNRPTVSANFVFVIIRSTPARQHKYKVPRDIRLIRKCIGTIEGGETLIESEKASNKQIEQRVAITEEKKNFFFYFYRTKGYLGRLSGAALRQKRVRCLTRLFFLVLPRENR